MSMEQSFFPEIPPLNRTADKWTAEPGSGEAWGIRRQAAGIIAMVLADSAPEQSRAAQDHLRKCLDANPGRPEIALAEHLSDLRQAAATGLPIEWLTTDPDAGGAETPEQPSLSTVRQLPTLRPDERGPVLHHHPTRKARYGRTGPRGLEGKSGDGS
jgi:hypothetical protein